MRFTRSVRLGRCLSQWPDSVQSYRAWPECFRRDRTSQVKETGKSNNFKRMDGRNIWVRHLIRFHRYYCVSDGIVIENNQRHSMENSLQLRLRPMISSLPSDDSLFMKSVNTIIKKRDSLSSHSDSRGNGIASRF